MKIILAQSQYFQYCYLHSLLKRFSSACNSIRILYFSPSTDLASLSPSDLSEIVKTKFRNSERILGTELVWRSLWSMSCDAWTWFYVINSFWKTDLSAYQVEGITFALTKVYHPTGAFQLKYVDENIITFYSFNITPKKDTCVSITYCSVSKIQVFSAREPRLTTRLSGLLGFRLIDPLLIAAIIGMIDVMLSALLFAQKIFQLEEIRDWAVR